MAYLERIWVYKVRDGSSISPRVVLIYWCFRGFVASFASTIPCELTVLDSISSHGIALSNKNICLSYCENSFLMIGNAMRFLPLRHHNGERGE